MKNGTICFSIFELGPPPPPFLCLNLGFWATPKKLFHRILLFSHMFNISPRSRCMQSLIKNKPFLRGQRAPQRPPHGIPNFVNIDLSVLFIEHKSVVLCKTLTYIYVKSSVENGYGREDLCNNYYFDTFTENIPDGVPFQIRLLVYNMLQLKVLSNFQVLVSHQRKTIIKGCFWPSKLTNFRLWGNFNVLWWQAMVIN